MLNFNVDASGQKLRVNFGRDVSTGTTFTVSLEPRSGDTLERVPTLGIVNVDVGDGAFQANEYVEYTTQADEFEFVGIWRAKGTATLASGEVVASDPVLFRVMP